MTISNEIFKFLKRYPKSWFFGGELERRLSTFHKPSSIGRILRDMAEGNLIYKDYEKVGKVRTVKYKWKK